MILSAHLLVPGNKKPSWYIFGCFVWDIQVMNVGRLAGSHYRLVTRCQKKTLCLWNFYFFADFQVWWLKIFVRVIWIEWQIATSVNCTQKMFCTFVRIAVSNSKANIIPTHIYAKFISKWTSCSDKHFAFYGTGIGREIKKLWPKVCFRSVDLAWKMCFSSWKLLFLIWYHSVMAQNVCENYSYWMEYWKIGCITHKKCVRGEFENVKWKCS